MDIYLISCLLPEWKEPNSENQRLLFIRLVYKFRYTKGFCRWFLIVPSICQRHCRIHCILNL